MNNYHPGMNGTRTRLCALPRWRSLARTAVTACTLAVLTTACLDVEMDFLVRDDGSGSMTLTMRMDEAVLEFAALEEGGAIEDLCESMLDDMDAGDVVGLGLDSLDSSAEAVVADGSCVVTTTVTWSEDQSDEVLAAIAEDDGPSFRRLADGGWRFELEMSSLADEELSLDDLELASAMGFDFPTLAVSVTLPGDAVGHNAHSVSQSNYAWEIDLAATDELPESLYVETAPGGGLGSAAIAGIVVGAVVLALALVSLLRRRTAGDAESTTTADDSTG